MSFPVFVDRSIAFQELKQGAQLLLAGSEAHHAVNVRRIRAGEQIEVINGCGLRVRLEVNTIAKNELRGKISALIQEPAAKIPIILVQALAKGGRDEQAIETATEFGVQQIIPWEAKRCIVSWANQAKEDKARSKWEASVLAASKQARRTWIPNISEKTTSKQLAKWVEAKISAGGKVFVCHEAGEKKLSASLRELSGDVRKTGLPESITFIVGPEGGIAPEELEILHKAGADTVLLGKHVLRSATAGPWAIAVTEAWCDSIETINNSLGDTQ